MSALLSSRGRAASFACSIGTHSFGAFVAFVAFAAFAMLALAPRAGAQTLLQSDNSWLALDDVAITPDDHYAVVRQNRYDNFVLVYDLATGSLVANPPANSADGLLGECLDAVAVTNTRAIVLGNRAQILDLTNPSVPVIASNEVGYHPRDVAITPDGTLACVRGGSTLGGHTGGLYIFDLASGAQVAFSAGEPTPYPAGPGFSFEVDDVAVTNNHALMTSFIDNGGGIPSTRVTIWELHPAGGGAPAVAFETTSTVGSHDQVGAPYDLAITPDGTKAVVRSELALGLYDLSVSPPAILWQSRLAGNPGVFNEEALDAVEVTNDRILTISKISNPALGSGTQVDVFEMNGFDHFGRIPGSPHDLAITPNGQRAVVRTNVGVYLYDLTQVPNAPELIPLARSIAPSSSIQYFAGLDSVVVTDHYAVTLSRASNLVDTQVFFWDISGPDLVSVGVRTIPNTRPVDVAITPDESKVAVAGNSNVTIFDLPTATQLYTHYPCPANAYYPWCNSIAVSNGRAVATGQWGPQNGWVSIVGIGPFP
jgi:WD40 repeat protein